MAGVKIRDVISIASGPETRIHPIAPPWAVAMAQIVTLYKSITLDEASI